MSSVPTAPSDAPPGLADRLQALRDGVDDDGYGAASMVQPGTGGQGLVGMTERARLHVGAVVARPRPGGGFSVRATLPYSA